VTPTIVLSPGFTVPGVTVRLLVLKAAGVADAAAGDGSDGCGAETDGEHPTTASVRNNAINNFLFISSSLMIKSLTTSGVPSAY
jgi:hypothetical protein